MRIWSEDEARLHILFHLTRLLQTIARTLGGWALKTEATYHDEVSRLH